jgi:histidinol-phosphate phosphatase family protein
MSLTPAIFLDKDGTLLLDQPYNVDPSRMAFAPGVADGLSRLAQIGAPLFVITNQPGVELGLFEEAALGRVRRRLCRMFAVSRARLSGFYYCPHARRDAIEPGQPPCNCRKPSPGLLQRAAREYGIDLHRSWLIGDILDDVEAGRRAGCRTMLIDGKGVEAGCAEGRWRVPDRIATCFDHAAAKVAAAMRSEAMA